MTATDAPDRTPLVGELQVTASVDDLAENDRLPVGVDALDRLLDAARHVVSWAEELREIAEAWPTFTPAGRDESATEVATLASDLLKAIDACAIASDGSAADYENR